ncbi:MAG: Pyridoxal 5'-phosphate synthase subunit PdxT [Chlamydiae bacterium]|nr:Pyridoxal 5'-phosphate synthase subunit PdxT [Chlamydiota bacterium]
MPHADRNLTIGILALQGAFARHQQIMDTLGVDTLQVRRPSELELCDGLILPGGESTTMTHLLQAEGMWPALEQFAKDKPVFGTCAGMILMTQLGLLDIAIERNGYGRQIHSFSTSLSISLSGGCKEIEALFIRAPRITKVESAKIDVLGKYQDEPVFIQQGYHLATTFHPELTDDPRVHRYFCDTFRKGVRRA